MVSIPHATLHPLLPYTPGSPTVSAAISQQVCSYLSGFHNEEGDYPVLITTTQYITDIFSTEINSGSVLKIHDEYCFSRHFSTDFETESCNS